LRNLTTFGFLIHLKTPAGFARLATDSALCSPQIYAAIIEKSFSLLFIACFSRLLFLLQELFSGS